MAGEQSFTVLWVDDDGIPGKSLQEKIPQVGEIRHFTNGEEFLDAFRQTIGLKRVFYILDGAFPLQKTEVHIFAQAGYHICRQILTEDPHARERILSYCGNTGETGPELQVTEVGKYEGGVGALIQAVQKKIIELPI